MAVPDPLPADRLRAGEFLADVDPDDLVYFLLNVGDGDTQLLLLPEERGARQAVVVDVGSRHKLPALVRSLEAAGLLAARPERFALVVATHPHLDHIEGMAEFVDGFHAEIREFWEPGWYTALPDYLEMMRALEDHAVLQSQPTSGMSRFIGRVRVQVLAPNIGLRNRFDTYGVNVNDASIALKVEFPASRVVEPEEGGTRNYVPLRGRTQALILGADAQTLSWAHVLVDFPRLEYDHNPLYRDLRMRLGADPLRAVVLKVSHHGSKHGVNLELVEAIRPALTLFSCVGGGGRHGFPHSVAQELVREAIQRTTSGQAREADHELGIHYTGALDTDGAPAGSMALVLSPSGRKRHLWRFGDGTREPVDLGAARLFS